MKLDVLAFRKHGARGLRCAVAVLGVCGRQAEPVRAADRAPFSEFASMSRGDLDSLQIKFTKVRWGLQLLPTFVVTAHGHPAKLSLFEPFYRPDFAYTSDFVVKDSVSLNTGTLAAFIDTISTMPDVSDGGVDPSSIWSFALGNTINGVPRVFESMLNTENTCLVFDRLRRASATDPRALREIEGYTCAFLLRTDSPPRDVTDSIGLAFAGARPDIYHHGQFVDRVRIRNTSEHDISAPLYLMLVPIGDVKLTNTDGQRCFQGPRTYFTALGTGTLRPGQSVEVRVELSNPRLEPIKYHFHQVLAGPGVP